jgi:hypothetical protein
VYAEENSNNSIVVVVKEQGTYVDSLGRLNIVGLAMIMLLFLLK